MDLSTMLHISRRQTTFWEFSRGDGVVRVHFKGKQEHSFVSGDCSEFFVTSEHPVLLDYRDDWASVYLSSVARDPRATLESAMAEVAALVGPWRSPSCYFNGMMAPLALLQAGSALWADAPGTVAERLCAVLKEAGVRYSVLPSRPARWPMQALIAGPHFVVASQFHIERRA